MQKDNSTSRTRTISVRIPVEEYEAFQSNVQNSGISQSEYFRKCLSGTTIHSYGTKVMESVCRIETLLNQEKLQHNEKNIYLIQEEVNNLCPYLR